MLSAPSSAGPPDSPLTHTRRRAVFSATASPPPVDEAGADINDQIRYGSLIFLLLYRDAKRKAPAPICKAIRGIERSPKHRYRLCAWPTVALASWVVREASCSNLNGMRADPMDAGRQAVSKVSRQGQLHFCFCTAPSGRFRNACAPPSA